LNFFVEGFSSHQMKGSRHDPFNVPADAGEHLKVISFVEAFDVPAHDLLV